MGALRDPRPEPVRALLAEGIGTACLLAVVVGSAELAGRAFDHHEGYVRLVQGLASGPALGALILAFHHASEAHFNPVVTMSEALEGRLSWGRVPGRVAAQLAGALLGVVLAHAMFGLPLLVLAQRPRHAWGLWISEGFSTFGLLLVIRGSARHGVLAGALAVGGFIMAGHWFTSSASFANPAVTLGRVFTGSGAGIRAPDALPFLAAQAVGGALACAALRVLGR